MRKRITAQAPMVGSPYIRHVLACDRPPEGRVRGWVAAMATGGSDNVPDHELVTRYGPSLRAECRAAGFEPDCDVPLAKQSSAARQAAKAWARHLLTEHTY